MAEKLFEAGRLPPSILDQRIMWIDSKGYGHFIIHMDEEEVLWAMDWLLRNASRVRTHYAVETLLTYDEDERPRHWMLCREVMRAFMERLIEIEARYVPPKDDVPQAVHDYIEERFPI
jgi:hypothetical protein